MRLSSTTRASLWLAAIAAGLYLNTLPAQFTFDDNFAVITNGDVSDPNKPLLALFKNDFWGQDLSSEMSHKSYRPFTILSFRLQRAIGQAFFGEARAEYVRQLEAEGGHDNSRGIDPHIFHLSNVAMHAAVTALVFRLALQLIAARRQQFSAARLAPSALDLGEAFIAALLFAVHPVHTEAVSGIVGHAELLCAALSIIGLLSYMAAADGRVPDVRSHWAHVGLAVALGWAAALTKEIGITIMGAMACYDLLVAPLAASFQSPKPLSKKATKAAKHASSKPHSHAPSEQQQQQQHAAAAGAWGQPGLRLKLLRLVATLLGVLIYVKGRSYLAGDQLVRIYRKVENPIPFSQSSLERKLTTGYLHSRYAGLLLAPFHLSADWSYACIDYVSSLSDPRNAATLALYLVLLLTGLAAQPWRVLAQWAGRLPAETDAADQARRWRLAVLTGLMVAPFFPASNVLFYVGTFIGERLMYFPSVGFCFLVAEWLAPVLLPVVEAYLDQGLKGVLGGGSGGHGRRFGLKTLLVGALLGTTVVLFSLKTLHRNTEWYDEERLFRAAQKVCGRSAKVQLNSGILERRYREWDKAVGHFKAAAAIDPTYCEPDYHIGITLVNTGKDLPLALDYLEKGVSCKYTAADSVKALNQVFAVLTQDQQAGATAVGARWSRILALPALKRYTEATYYCEQTALLFARGSDVEQTQAAVDKCRETLANAEPSLEGRSGDFPIRVPAPPELLDTLKACLEARAQVLLAIAGAPGSEDARLNSTAVKAAAYSYFAAAGGRCRKPLAVAEAGSEEDAAQRGASLHMELVHVLQKVDSADPWLQAEWAKTMFDQGRASDGMLHTQVAGQLLRGELDLLLRGEASGRLGPDGAPLTIEAAAEGAVAAYRAALEVSSRPEVAGRLKDAQGRPVRVNCIMQIDMCSVYDVLTRAPEGSLSAGAVQEAAGRLVECVQQARRMSCPVGAAEAGQHGAAGEEEVEEEEEEGRDEL